MTTKRIVLRFPYRLVEEPVAYRLVKDYDLEFNILKASVTPDEEGYLVLELKGEDSQFEKGLAYLKKMGLHVEPLSKDIVRDDKRCTHCGACVAICPTAALAMDSKTRLVEFIEDKCIACELCVPACPPRAMEVRF
jgi:L-aspartate semialdehyde sulfurtransferase ferredoxin